MRVWPPTRMTSSRSAGVSCASASARRQWARVLSTMGVASRFELGAREAIDKAFAAAREWQRKLDGVVVREPMFRLR